MVSLLDEFFRANPYRGKSETEQADERKKYKVGENVLPKLRRRRSAPEDEADARALEQIRHLSLREAGVATSRLEEPRDRHRSERLTASRSRDPSGNSRHQRSQDRSSRRRSQEPPRREPSPRDLGLEHQASLRSLLSVSDLRPDDLGEEIMRQIAEEGLLDGVDLNNINVTQEEELREMIAQMYRTRVEERRHERESTRDRSSHDDHRNSNPSAEPPQEQDRQGSLTINEVQFPRPPATQPNRRETTPSGRSRQRESDRQGPSRSRTTSQSSANHDHTSQRPAVALTDASSERSTHREGIAVADFGSGQVSSPVVATPTSPHQSTRTASGIYGAQSHTTTPNPSHRGSRSPRVSASGAQRPSNNSSPSLVTSPDVHQSPAVSNSIDASTFLGTPTTARPTTSSSTSAMSSRTMFSEPSVSCNSCGKAHIEYELHYNCSRCHNGQYNICLRCFRSGKKCLYRPGHERLPLTLASEELPHVFAGRRYLRPTREPVVSPEQSRRVMTDEDPAKRLQLGVFCDICHDLSNACYWKCESCNGGAWGFCNRCVNQGKHCTHPLLPLAQKQAPPQSDALQPDGLAVEPSSTPPLTPKSASVLRGTDVMIVGGQPFRPLTFSTVCDFCSYPIPPSCTRYHCPKCNDGDYDMCTSCYQSLVHRGGISAENGHFGWRRCIKGHRMIVVGFEDRDGGQRRVVVNDLVGGVTLKEEEAFASRIPGGNLPPEPQSPQNQQQLNWYWTNMDGTMHRNQGAHSRQAFVAPSKRGGGGQPEQEFPPDGGVGLRGIAKWGFFPTDGVSDELMFPRGAEIREAENINGDWFWGVYCGAKGLFPGGYIQIMGGT